MCSAVELLPAEQRRLLKWKMSTVTPNVVKHTIARSHFKVTKSKSSHVCVSEWCFINGSITNGGDENYTRSIPKKFGCCVKRQQKQNSMTCKYFSTYVQFMFKLIHFYRFFENINSFWIWWRQHGIRIVSAKHQTSEVSLWIKSLRLTVFTGVNVWMSYSTDEI